MFSKSKSGLEAKAVPSIISADLTIKGDLVTSGEIHIDGEVFGDIRARAVTIGEHADIHGEIVAESIVVKGKVTGRMRGRAVHLTRTARTTGDIWHKTLGVEGGAIIQGQCRHMDEPDMVAPPSGGLPVLAAAASDNSAWRSISDAGLPELAEPTAVAS